MVLDEVAGPVAEVFVGPTIVGRAICVGGRAGRRAVGGDEGPCGGTHDEGCRRTTRPSGFGQWASGRPHGRDGLL